MRFLGARLPSRPAKASQAYLKKRGQPANLTTFRGKSVYDYETLGTPDAYQAPVVYACVSRISRTISQLPRKVRRISDNQVMTAPFWIEAPNSYQGGTDFIKSICASLLLWGEAFLIPARTGRGATTNVAVVNPQYVTHYVQSQMVRWYINGTAYDGEMVHLRNDALPGKVRGLGAANIFSRLIQTNLEAQKFILNVVEQGGAYQLGITFPEDVDDDVLEDTALQVVARHAGAGNAYLPLVLSGGAQIVPINQSNADGAFIDLSDMTAKQIATMMYGVDETLLGFKSDQPQVYQNNAAIWFRFWTLACKHIAAEIERGLTLLLPRGQRYDLEEWEVLLGGPHDRARLSKEMASVNSTMGSKVFTEDELRQVVGMYPLPEYEPMGTDTSTEEEEPEVMPDDDYEPVGEYDTEEEM